MARCHVHTYLPYACSPRKIFVLDERRKTIFVFIDSNDARGQCDSFCPKIIKIAAILIAFWPVQSLGFQAKSSWLNIKMTCNDSNIQIEIAYS